MAYLLKAGAVHVHTYNVVVCCVIAETLVEPCTIRKFYPLLASASYHKERRIACTRIAAIALCKERYSYCTNLCIVISCMRGETHQSLNLSNQGSTVTFTDGQTCPVLYILCFRPRGADACNCTVQLKRWYQPRLLLLVVTCALRRLKMEYHCT